MNNYDGIFISPNEKYGITTLSPFNKSEIGDSITPVMIKNCHSISNLSGKGITVGIICAFEYKDVLSDFYAFCKRFSLDAGNVTTRFCKKYAFAPQHIKEKWINEAALDLQWVRSFSNDSDIICYFARSDDINDVFPVIKEADSECDIVLLSFGVTESAGHTLYEDFFENSNALYICASGNGSGIYYPSSSKYTLSVGATDIYFDRNGNKIGQEHYKKGSCGISKYIKMPSHQKSFVYGNNGKRCCPDVTFFSGGNKGAYFYCAENGGHLSASGTSVSAACITGICASIAQIDKNIITKKASFFYELAQNGKYNDLFVDIVMGRNENYKTAKGYDLCTGLGTPNAQKIIQFLSTRS